MTKMLRFGSFEVRQVLNQTWFGTCIVIRAIMVGYMIVAIGACAIVPIFDQGSESGLMLCTHLYLAGCALLAYIMVNDTISDYERNR